MRKQLSDHKAWVVFGFAVCIAVLIWAMCAPRSDAQTTTSTKKLAWDAPTTNADGTPLADLSGYEVGVGLTGSGPAGVSKTMPLPASQTAIAISDVLAGLPGAESEYEYRVRSIDTSGNASTWAGPVDALPPGPPVKVRITVEVTVGE